MIVRPFTPLACSARIRFSGLPHRPNPPDMMTAPSWRSATAASADAITLSIVFPLPSARFITRVMGIITLTTDFGTQDGYVGAMKGVILAMAPGTTIVDITHEVPPFDVQVAAFTLAQAAPFFPDRTVHICIVDP